MKAWVKAYRSQNHESLFLLKYANIIMFALTLLYLCPMLYFEPDFKAIVDKIPYLAAGGTLGLTTFGILQDARFRRQMRNMDRLVARTERKRRRISQEQQQLAEGINSWKQ